MARLLSAGPERGRGPAWAGLVMAAVLAGNTGSAFGFCNSALETYAIFQCGQKAYFAPVPSPFSPADVTGVFWQIGFGNATVNTGLGTDGTGFASSKFNGNDSGIFPVDFLDAAVRFPALGFPAGSVCLGSNNWANSGVDGCCDNPRASGPFYYANFYAGLGTYPYLSDDNILNPYFGAFQYYQGYPGYFSRASIVDYPVAVLAKLPGDEYFAVAAVTNSGILSTPANRGNNFDPNDASTHFGPCNVNNPGTNPAACDHAQGAWFFSNVANGAPNGIPSEAGRNNVIPWQEPPAPTLDPNADVHPDPNDPSGERVIVDVSWPAVTIHHDGRSVPSNNPTLDTLNPAQPGDHDAAPGVGVSDILGKFGLVRYQVLVEALDPNDPYGPGPIVETVDCPGDPRCTSATSATLNIDRSELLRIRTILGTTPRETAQNAASCRLGRCGDIGFQVTGPKITIDPCFPSVSSESCNFLDDDGDGYTDECLGLGETCDGVGECGQGVIECDPEDPPWWSGVRCSTDRQGSEDQSSPEVCDALDNDCDGRTDEGLTSTPTTCGVGSCASTGAITCQDGTIVDTCAPGQPTAESCDSLDHDCDGIPANPTRSDLDQDGVDDGCDNCPAAYNPGQEDSDGDGTGNACEPLVVTLASFEGEIRGSQVILTWATASENDNAGFNVYRSASPAGPWEKRNEALIPSEGSATSGAVYTFTERRPRAARVLYYLLEDVDLSGNATRHPAIEVVPGRGRSGP